MKETAPTWYVQVTPVSAASDDSFARVISDAKVASQERLKRELLAFLQELSRRRPLALLCDDLHWADVSTVDLLGYVGSRAGTMRLLVIGTYRPSDLLLGKHPFLNVQRELQSRGLCREIAIRLLDERSVAAYIDTTFPGHDFPAHFPGLLHSRTEGNPLFLTELLRDLRDRSLIERREGRFRLAQSVPSIEGELPESVRGMIDRKVDRIDEADRRLLACAAVQGYEFDSATVASAMGAEAGAVEERLDALARVHRFVSVLDETELPDGELSQRYRFVHVLYHNALYGALRPRQRAELSASVAAALVRSHGEHGADIAAQLAYLFETSRQFEAAADHFLIAAQQAVVLFANREATELARRALVNGGRLDGHARHARTLAAALRLGQLHLTLSEMDQAIEAFGVAERAAAELGDVDAQVDAICAGALAHFNSKRTDQATREAERARSIARAADSTTAAAAAELVLASVSFCLGASGEAQRDFERSVPILRQQTPPTHALEAIGFSGLLYAWQLEYESAERAVARSTPRGSNCSSTSPTASWWAPTRTRPSAGTTWSSTPTPRASGSTSCRPSLPTTSPSAMPSDWRPGRWGNDSAPGVPRGPPSPLRGGGVGVGVRAGDEREALRPRGAHSRSSIKPCTRGFTPPLTPPRHHAGGVSSTRRGREIAQAALSAQPSRSRPGFCARTAQRPARCRRDSRGWRRGRPRLPIAGSPTCSRSASSLRPT